MPGLFACGSKFGCKADKFHEFLEPLCLGQFQVLAQQRAIDIVHVDVDLRRIPFHRESKGYYKTNQSADLHKFESGNQSLPAVAGTQEKKKGQHLRD